MIPHQLAPFVPLASDSFVVRVALSPLYLPSKASSSVQSSPFPISFLVFLLLDLGALTRWPPSVGFFVVPGVLSPVHLSGPALAIIVVHHTLLLEALTRLFIEQISFDILVFVFARSAYRRSSQFVVYIILMFARGL